MRANLRISITQGVEGGSYPPLPTNLIVTLKVYITVARYRQLRYNNTQSYYRSSVVDVLSGLIH